MRFQETETVELKSIVMDDIKKEIIAFANCDGGTVHVGVTDDGTVLVVCCPDHHQHLSGKLRSVRQVIVPFATSGGSGMGQTNVRLAPSCKGAKLLEGKMFKRSAGHKELALWVENLNI